MDIPINVKDPSGFIDFFYTWLKNAKKMNSGAFIKFRFIDHHETDLQFLDMFPYFVQVLYFPSAYDLDMFLAGQNSEGALRDIAILGAVGDRDFTVFKDPVFRARKEEFLEMARGLDVLVRENIDKAIETVYLEELEKLKDYADKIPKIQDDKIELVGTTVALYREPLDSSWSPKQLEMAAEKLNVPYAIGIVYVPFKKMWVIRAITHWLSGARPVKEFVSSATARTVIGHPTAISIAATDQNDAASFAEAFARHVAKKTSNYKSLETVLNLDTIDPNALDALRSF